MRAKSPPPLRSSQKIPWKTVFLTLFLTTAGIIFVGVGLSQYFKKGLTDAFLYFLLGTMVAIPGVFYGFIFVAACRRWPGYTYEMIPVLE